MPRYTFNGKTYNIPDSLVNKFENENPNATVAYNAGGKKYNIPVNKRDKFLKAFPDATIEGTPQAYTPNDDTIGAGVGAAIANAAAKPQRTEPQPTQPQPQQRQQAQPVQLPQGFGQLDMTANQFGRQSWEQPQQQPKEETAVDKQARMLSGKATKQEQQSVQKRTGQRLMEADYGRETGKRLRTAAQFEAPTVQKDENGNILTGVTTDQEKAGAHQQVVKEQEEYDVNKLLGEAYAERDRIKALLKNDKNGERALRDVIMSGGYDPTPNDDIEARNDYTSALRLIDRRIDALETMRDNGGFWGGTGDVLSDPSSYSFGLTDLEDAKALQRINKKIEDARTNGIEPQFTDSEQALINAHLLNQQAQAKVADNDWYQMGRGFGQSLSFMKDFAATGGGFMGLAKGGMALGAKGGAKLAATTLGDYMTKNLGTRALGKLMVAGGKGVGLVAGAEAGGLALNNTIQAASNAADVINKQIGNLAVDKDGKLSFENSKSLGEAILKSQLSRGGENASELVGLAFDAVPGILGKVIQKTKVGQFAKNIANSKFWKGSEKALNYLGVQSVWGEGMEEEYNMARDVLIGESNWFKDPNDPSKPAFFDGEQQLKTWEQVGITSMLLRVPAMIATGTQQANYYANMYNLNGSDKNMRGVFDNDERYEAVKSMIDGADNGSLPGVLNNLMNNAQLTPEEKEATFFYANDLVKVRGFNIGNVVAAAEGYQEPPKVASYNIKGNSFDEVDADGNVLNHYEFDNPEEMRAALYESQQNRFDGELNSDIGVMKSRPNDQYGQLVQDYLLQSGTEMLPSEFEEILSKPSMERTEAEQTMVLPFARLLHDTVYDNTMLHEEKSDEDGASVAEQMAIDLDAADPAEAQGIVEAWNAAQQALDAAFAKNEALEQEVRAMEEQGMPHQGIISSLETFSPQEQQVVIDYYNQQAKYNGFVNRMGKKIAEEAANRRQRVTHKGTINGVADLNNVHSITDGTNEYYLVSGDVVTDPTTGEITDSTSGLIIGMDENGNFVNIGDTNGYRVLPVMETLDQWEEGERIRLEEDWTGVIAPNGTMGGVEVQPQPAIQGGNQDNAGGEAGVNGGTGANEPPASAPANTVGAEVAAEWLLGSGQNAINSTDYLLKAFSGVFPRATQVIEAIRQKYAQQIANDPTLAEIKDFMNSPLRNQIESEIKDAINQAYPNNAEVQDIFDIIMQHPTGLPSRIGQEVQRKLDNLENQSAQPQQPAVTIESVADKDGIKRYENGISVDDAIADIIADGFDVNEVADASIAEAQAVVDKINGKKTKTRKDLIDKKRAQDVVDYYDNVKARWAEVNAEAVPQSTGNPINSEPSANAQPEQPIVEERPATTPSNLTVEEQKQQRISEAKAKYGELFDDDFTKANDVYELVSMWVGRKRNLAWDDVKGKRGLQKELGWTRKIGGDTKYIETLLAKNGEGMGVDEFVHMVWESPENSIGNEKRWGTEEIKDALLDLLKSAGSKSDVVDYALNSRIARAENDLRVQQERAAEEPAATATETVVDIPDGQMPFGMPTDEDFTNDVNETAAVRNNNVSLQPNNTDNEQGEMGSLPEGGYDINGANEAAASLLKGLNIESDSERPGSGSKERLLAELEKSARAAGLWSEDDVAEIAEYELSRGGENEVYTTDGDDVIKLNNFGFLRDDATNFDDFLNRIESFNELFPDVALRLVGFAKNSRGEVCVVMLQPAVFNNHEATEEEIDNALEEKGFYTDMSGNWTDGRYVVSDLKPNNVLVDEKGVLHFIDVVTFDETKPGQMMKAKKPQANPEQTAPAETQQDSYLQPRNVEEEQIVANVEATLQREIAAQEERVKKAKKAYDKKLIEESARATDMFSDDETRREQGQLFGFDEMPTDRSREGVEHRAEAEKLELEAAEGVLEELESQAEHDSRVRGALDNYRRQTTIEPEANATGVVTEGREQYLASHPLTEEQIMADTEATEDEKLNAIDFLNGEDNSAISQFYYDSIYERAQSNKNPAEKKPTVERDSWIGTTEEEFYPAVKEWLDAGNSVSVSGVQRHFKVGYNKATKAIERYKEEKNNSGQQPKWQYQFHYDKETGRAWITRDNVSGSIPIGDGRFRIEGRSLSELRGILENPKNNLGELLKEVEAQLHNAEALEKWRRENDPMAAIEDAARLFRGEQKSKDQQDIDDALREFNDFLDNAKGSNVLDKFMRKGLEGNDKAQASLLDAFTLTNDAQRMFLKDLLRLASKVGYAYIKSGIHDAQEWRKKMYGSIGAKLKSVLDWDVSIITEFVDEVWNQKYTVDGQRMRLSEHAERLKNTKQEVQAVNVNKQEDNEPKNVVSSQQKPASELEGDSAEFADRQYKIEQLSKKIRAKLQGIMNWGDQPKPLSAYKQIAKELGIENLSDTDLQELIETEVASLAREIANKEGLTEEKKFQKIVKLYEGQPSLNARDNDRINKQQYSTPAPMAYLMGKFIKVDSGNSPDSNWRGLEPSAGNGMLTIALPKEQMRVNDIDEMRLSNLQKQGFGEVTNQDGLQSFGEKQYDAIVTNPPFGNVAPKVYDVYEISGLEHQMAINALDAMKDDGRAAIIIGGNTEYTNSGVIKGKDRAFLNYLYSHYNVVDVINMDGKSLYTRQGTGYPVRMILINGRKTFEPNAYAPVQSKARAEQVKTYEELYKRVNDDILSDNNKPASVHDTASGESRRVDDTGNAGTSTQTGVRNVLPEGSEGQSSERPADRRSVSRGDNTTGRANRQEQPSVGGGLFAVGGREEANESSRTANEPAGEQRPEPRGDDTQRPASESGNSERVGQRGSADAQRDNGAAITSQQTEEEQPQVKRGLGTEKVPYRKQSGNPFTLQSLMPAEQADVVKKALEELGDVDQFLVDELGYSSKDELHQALAAEQIDSVALAIHQMNNGSAFIIGDQTGIGKGRQAAALIRYGVRKGGCPVFITVKKGLFSDMYRDLCDIGSPKLRPFIWSADDAQHSGAVTDKDGNVIYEMPSAKEQKRVVDYINKYGKLPKEYDYVLTTYDSFKSGTMDYEDGKKSPRKFPKGKSAGAVHINGQAKRDALETLAGNSYVIMDESHNAGGEGSNVSNYLQYITTKAKGLTFLSATFAKRPGNMPIYSLKTAISKAGVKVGELIDAVKRGGATFQEIMSKALTEAGQMIRRERDMTGVTIDWRGIEDEAVIEQQREQYDKIIGLFNDIIDFQRTYIDPIIDQLNDEAADAQGEVDHTPGTRDMGINNTPFASRTYNMVQQVLLSLKAEEAAKRAIEHLKLGRKPVITVANTNEGAADAVSATDGESMEMPDLGVNLKKGLQGTLRIQTKDANGDAKQGMIPFERLPQEAQKRYAEIMDAIENSSSGLSLSPIDVIKNELKKAGYKVGELTGRQAEFVYNEDGTVRRVRRQDTDKKKVAADFNNGKLDALILNRSAGTGISLHASSKFDDQRQRIMIVAQAQGDVNDEVQIRGRIDRTGQVLRGMYEYVVSQIPSEQRLLMMLKAKLRSLDANTTSSQKSKFNEMQVQDIMNKYGDQIVVQYLAENPDTYAKLADPLKWGDNVYDMPVDALIESASRPQGDGATASKILGRMALLTVKEQEKMLDDLGVLYQAEIDRLNEMGENDLEITEMPLKAKTLSKQVWEQGIEPNGKNPFADNTYVEKVQMDVLKKPMKASEVKASQERLLAGKTWEEFKAATMAKIDEKIDAKKKEATETITARAEKRAQEEQERYVKGAKKAQKNNQMTDEEIDRNGRHQYDHFYKEGMDKLKDSLAAIDSQRQVFVDALETFSTDGVYALPSNIYDLGSMTFEPGMGKLIDVKITDNLSPNASTLSFATLDGRRKITVPINGKVKQQNGQKADLFPTITTLTAQTKSGWFGQNVANTLKVLEQNVDNWDKLTSTAARKEGYIITGNLLKALVSTREQGVGGKLISYTTDTGEVRQGILMPDNFEPKGLTSKTPISSKKEELKYSGDKIESADGEISIKVASDYDWDTRSYNTLILSVPKSTKRGGKYFNDEVLLSLVNGQFEGSSKMWAEFKRDNLDAVLKRLDELGVTVNEEHKEDNNDSNSARRYDEDIENKASRRSVEKVRQIFDNLAAKYKSWPIECVSLSETGDRELVETFFPNEIGDATEEEIREAAVNLREYFKKANATIDRETGKIIIFADKVKEGEEENTFFHENIHGVLTRWYGKSSRSVADRFWQSTPEKINSRTKSKIEDGYKEQSDTYKHDEWLTYNLADAMSSGDFSKIDEYLSSDDNIRINNILNELGYDRQREEEARKRQKAVSHGEVEERHRERSVRHSSGRRITEQHRRIAKHIDSVVKKLGTKARTTVYHSFDELPEADKKYIREAEKRGRKVRGWYENGQIYLYLPHIDSEYQAEKVIWHETVAHHGLRALLGEENYNQLLKRLWLDSEPDSDMRKWVAERMQSNGWNMGKAIDEWLAREAEKPINQNPSLWQRLKWWVSDILREMGFNAEPNINDIRYLFWVSKNQLKSGEPLSAIKSAAFLHRLERENAGQYVNLFTNREEDVYNPEADGAFVDEGVRYSEETDKEVIDRLEREPKVKAYRAMSLIDGKLYPPMATKQDGNLVNPIELGKWEKSDEHPEKAVLRNGKWVFKLTKDNGKSLYAAYNPYIHTSTTMLNDQFSEAQNRGNLVVVEVEVPESELTSGYKAEKAKDSVGKMDWKAGIIQGQLSGTREVILSRWDKPVRIVPTEEVAQHIADMIKDKVEVMPTNVVTPQQREALEKLGVKFVETDNRGFIKYGENKGKSYSSVYGKKAAMESQDNVRRYSEDIDEPVHESAKEVYNETLDSKTYVATEAFQDSMLALKVAQNAIAKGEKIPDSQNAYQAENLMHGKNKNEMDLYNLAYRDPIIDTVNKILAKMGWTMRDMNQYLLTKSGLERNRELFVRDWFNKQRRTIPRSYDDLNWQEQEIYDKLANSIETSFEDGDITEEKRDELLEKAINEAHQSYLDDLDGDWQRVKREGFDKLNDEDGYTLADYLHELTDFIQQNIETAYDPSENDYSGLTELYGDEDGVYDEDAIIEQVMNDETSMDDGSNGLSGQLWEQMKAANTYALERYRTAGMKTDAQIDRVEHMFHWYVPMRGFDKNTGEDMYQYFTSRDNANSYVGGLVKTAKGRKSRAKAPLATMFAMAYKAIGDSNQNLVNQHLYRFLQAHKNDLVNITDAWAKLNERTGVWEETYPAIPEDASEEQVRQAMIAYDEEMRELASEGKAKKITGKAKFDYVPADKKKRAEHIVEVMINGQKRYIVVTGNPRMAQALNGKTRFESGHNVFSKANAWVKNKMSALFTSYSPTFAMRNLARDWTHFAMMLNTREGAGYARAAMNYYRETMPRPIHTRGKEGMVSLFKKYRDGSLDMNKQVERDFKDFMDNGGITGFVFMQKVDDIEKQLENISKQMNVGKTIKLNNKLWDATLGLVEAYNEAIENNARFATFRTSRHYAGRTKARSAYDAKEITVNFNRKGSGSKVYGFKSQDKDVTLAAQLAGVTSQILGEGRIFFNATVQAIATTFKNFKNPDGSYNKKYISKWAVKYALPPFLLGLALPMINNALASMLGSGDDDDPYANLPEWTRRKNICFYVGDGNFITIPIGQELAAFLALGDIAAGRLYADNLKPVDKGIDEEMLGVLNTFSPVDIDTKVTEGGFWSKDMPLEAAGKAFSVATPAISVISNRSWTGRPIYREDRFPGDEFTPEYQKVYRSTNPVLVEGMKKLHELGGGDDVMRGKLEVNPAIVQYLWEQYAGGPGKVFSNAISLGKDFGDLFKEGEMPDFNMRKVEGVKAFVQQGDDRTAYYRTQAKYRKYKADADRLNDAINGYKALAGTDPTALVKLQELTKGEDFVRMMILKQANKSLSKLYKAANQMEDAKREQELRRLYNQMVKMVVEELDKVGEVSSSRSPEE